MRWFLSVLMVIAVGASAAVSAFVLRGGSEEAIALPRSPMPGRVLVGLQDDATFRWSAERGEMLDRAREAHASLIRTIVAWSDVAPTRPARPADPFDPAYELDDVDDLVRSAQQRGIEVLITIWGTPEWANGGQRPNRPPRHPDDLESFASALAERYSGRHAGYPAVRLFSAWNEPNLEQFLAPQFDAAGRSVGPALYAPLARAVYDGVKRANPDALVAVGETSPRGHDVLRRGRVQESHSPARFARLLSEARPKVHFDAWAQHPYPPRAEMAPADPVRWPRVGLGNLERFGLALDEWFERDGTPFWITEYAHETKPPESLGIDPELQARYAEDALALTVRSERVRMFVWFVLRDRDGNPWQSGLLSQDGLPKPAFDRFAEAARQVDGRNPVVQEEEQDVRVPALELAFHNPAGTAIEVAIERQGTIQTPLEQDGWIEVPVDGRRGQVVVVRATDRFGNSVSRTVRIGDALFQVD